MHKLTAGRKAAPILVFFLSLAASAAHDFGSIPTQPTPKDVEQLITDPQVIMMPKFVRYVLVKQVAKNAGLDLTNEEIDKKLDSSERHLNKQTKRPARSYLGCAVGGAYYCQPYYHDGQLTQAMKTPEIDLEVTTYLGTPVKILLSLSRFASIKNFDHPPFDVVPDDAEFYAIYPGVVKRQRIQETSRLDDAGVPFFSHPERIFPGGNSEPSVIRFATEPGDQTGIFRILLGNYSCEFWVDLKGE